MFRRTKVGDYIRTIPEIQAINLALKGQIADNLSFMRKANEYDNGSVMASITGSITPIVYKAMNPPLSKEECQSGYPAAINQYILKKLLKEYKNAKFTADNKEYSFYTPVQADKTKFEKGLKLWWAWAGRGLIKALKPVMQAEAAQPNFKNTVNTAYTDVSGYKDQYAKYRALMDKV